MEVPKELKDEIWEYCRMNDITDVEGFMLEMLKTGFNIEKYGTQPSEVTAEKKNDKDDKKENEEDDGKIKELSDQIVEKEEKITELEQKILELNEKLEGGATKENEDKEQKEEQKTDIYGEEGPPPASHGSNLYNEVRKRR